MESDNKVRFSYWFEFYSFFSDFLTKTTRSREKFWWRQWRQTRLASLRTPSGCTHRPWNSSFLQYNVSSFSLHLSKAPSTFIPTSLYFSLDLWNALNKVLVNSCFSSPHALKMVLGQLPLGQLPPDPTPIPNPNPNTYPKSICMVIIQGIFFWFVWKFMFLL